MTRPVKKAEPEIVKTTLRFPRTLWNKIQHRAVDEGLSLQDLAERAFVMYLKTKAGQP
jgi:hypothetical protein